MGLRRVKRSDSRMGAGWADKAKHGSFFLGSHHPGLQSEPSTASTAVGLWRDKEVADAFGLTDTPQGALRREVPEVNPSVLAHSPAPLCHGGEKTPHTLLPKWPGDLAVTRTAPLP